MLVTGLCTPAGTPVRGGGGGGGVLPPVAPSVPYCLPRLPARAAAPFPPAYPTSCLVLSPSHQHISRV